MTNKLKTIKLTDREVELVLECIGTNIETVKRRHPVTGSTADLIQELAEMDMDIREQAFRGDDGDIAPPDLVMTVPGATTVKATKATSRAAERRQVLFRKVSDQRSRSETQQVDVWSPPFNDPAKW